MSVNDSVKDAVKLHTGQGSCDGHATRRCGHRIKVRKVRLFGKCRGSIVWSMHPVTPAGALIGRDSEMALLTGLIKEVARGRGGSVLIEGEPGIGKSALVRAAVAEAPEAGCEVFWGAGDELGQALPLLPFLDGLRVREPSANPRRNAIVRLLRGEVAADRGTDVPAVLAEQLLALVAEQCAARPTILVVDDLQWADQASVTLWGRLARSARQVPLLLIGMMRPVPQRDDLLALRRAVGDDRPAPAHRAPRGGGGRPGGRPGRRQARRRPAAARRRGGGQPALRHRAGRRAGPQLQPDRHRGGSRRAGGRFRAGLAVGGHRGPAWLRGRPGARGAAGGGPARHGFRGL